MSKDVYTITCSALPDSARVAGFRGTEAISRLYDFHVYVLVGADGNDLDLADALGAKATLTLSRGDDRPAFTFNGVFASFELLHEFDDRSLFHAVLVPQAWYLTQTFHSRVWTNMSVPDILKEVLEDGGLASSDYDLRLTQTYKPEEHICQYMESNFDFISRWMEREGMYYYFEQGDSSEVLVITDSKGKHEALDAAPVRFFPLGGHDGSSGEALHSFRCKYTALPASVKLQDYDYMKPTLDVSGSAPVSRVGLGEISVYGQRFFTPDDGKRLAALRAEELLARQVVYNGAGTEFHLRPGYTFTLEDHPRPAFDQKYLAVEVTHTGNQAIASPELREVTGIDSDRVYWVEVKAIPASVQFRAERTTPWPRIYGYENGTICGPAETDYAQIDDAGRYNVKFKFDESDLRNGKASTFVRMMQPHGGSPEGFHFPLRKGTEVLFTFLGGDPDRPVIAGVVNDTRNPSPVTKGNNTRNVLQTGGRNRWELEDKAGQERITMSTPHSNSFMRMGSPNGPDGGHTMIIQTDQATLMNAGADFNLEVGQIEGSGDWTGLVKNSWKTDVQGGGWSVGVVETAVEPEAGKLNFLVHDDIEIKTVLGNYTLDVPAGKSTTTVQNGCLLTVELYDWINNIETGAAKIQASKYVKLVSEKDAIILEAQQKIEATSSAANIEMTAKTGIGLTSTGGDIEIKAPVNNIEITAVDVTATSTGKKKWACLGDSIALTIAATSETLIGIKNENLIGGKAEILIGGKAEMWFAAKLEIGAGVRFSAVPEETKILTAKIDTVQHKLEAAVTAIHTGATWVSTHAAHVFA